MILERKEAHLDLSPIIGLCNLYYVFCIPVFVLFVIVTFQLQQTREQELRASEDAIRQLQEEESRLVRSLEHQALQDEELARKIVSEEREQVNDGLS